MYDQIVIANTIIKKAIGLNIPPYINHIKLQQLMYLSHAWVLVLTENPLIDEEFYVWKRGPILPRIYSYFCRFSDTNITELAIIPVPKTNNWDEPILDKKNKFINVIIDKVISHYGYCCTELLDKKINVKNGPWHQALKNNDCMISNKLIKKHMDSIIKNIKELI